MLWNFFRKELLFVTIYLIGELFSILNWGTFLQKEDRKPWSYSGIETLLTHLITEVIPDLFVLLRVRLIGEFDTNAEVWWGGSVQSPYFCNCFSFVLQLLVILKLKLVISETSVLNTWSLAFTCPIDPGADLINLGVKCGIDLNLSLKQEHHESNDKSATKCKK